MDALTQNRFTSAVAERVSVAGTQLNIALELIRKKPITIRLFGDAYCREVYEIFTAPHPKLPLVQRNSFGAALRALEGPLEELFSGPQFAYFRRRVGRAERLGYHVIRIDPHQYLDQIMCIHNSSVIRQGRMMRTDYLDLEKVREYLMKPGEWYGVLDPQARLHAYCHLPIVGDCSIYSRILGDHQTLGDGIMFLLVDHTVKEMHRRRSTEGYPGWIMYDMFLGGTNGLRDFKTRCGFRPERVAWTWTERETASP
ncbi:MAG: hypothetical protein JO227_01415, partial [Acetobacteraceae bacterium]|nr:hypothetical protein [Acetobacteraceae bacterium]